MGVDPEATPTVETTGIAAETPKPVSSLELGAAETMPAARGESDLEGQRVGRLRRSASCSGAAAWARSTRRTIPSSIAMVAIKLLRPEVSTTRADARLRREARAMARLSHPQPRDRARRRRARRSAVRRDGADRRRDAARLAARGASRGARSWRAYRRGGPRAGGRARARARAPRLQARQRAGRRGRPRRRRRLRARASSARRRRARRRARRARPRYMAPEQLERRRRRRAQRSVRVLRRAVGGARSRSVRPFVAGED